MNVTFTQAEAWCIFSKVRQNDHGKPWGAWGERLWLKMLGIALSTEPSGVVDVTRDEMIYICSQVSLDDTFGIGSSKQMVGLSILSKIGNAWLEYEAQSVLADLYREGGETDGNDHYRAGSDQNSEGGERPFDALSA